MVKKLIIAEKPSVSRDIAKVLGCKVKGDGYIEGKDYIITWAIGHLITLAEPDDYDEKLKRWNYKQLPIIPKEIKLKPYPKTERQLNIITNLSKRKDVDSIICATDSGREGELIFRYIYHFIKCDKSFERLWISSMTDTAIKEGFEKLKDGKFYDNLYHSAKCRSEADWLVGINATRAYTTSNNVLLSIGRVQTPTLALIVDRQNSIDDFTPKDYFEIVADFGDFKGTWFKGKSSQTKILDKTKLDTIIEKVRDKEGIVEKIIKKKKNEKPPLLYDLTELQRDGNKIYGFTAKDVLTIAQELYEKKKMVTYPRTDSRYLSDDMKKVVEDTMKKIKIHPYNKAIQPLLAKGKLKFTKRIIDNKKITDHHAIIPTNVVPNINSLTKDQLKIFNLIVKRFISVFYEPHIFETTEIITQIENENFSSKGKVIIDDGWKALYKTTGKEKGDLLPKLKKGDNVKVNNLETLKKKTSPPKLFTEASLLSAMENAGRYIKEEDLKEQLKDSGFGTPATRAGIIERLIQVQYIERKKKSLIPTKKGIKLIKIIPEELRSPNTTGKWEKCLNKISKGDMETEKFMNSIKRFTLYLVQSAQKTKGKVVFEQNNESISNSHNAERLKNSLGKCPLCEDGQILSNSKAYYCTNWKGGCKFTAWKNTLDAYDKNVDDELIKEIIKKKKIDNFEVVFTKTNQIRNMTLFFSEEGKLILKYTS